MLIAESPTKLNQFSVEAERHLLCVAEHDSGIWGVEASALLGENYWIAHWPQKAIPFLRRTPPRSEGRVLLASLLFNARDFEAAEAEAKACRETFEMRLRENPADLKARLKLADCLMILKEYPLAINVCGQGISSTMPEGAVKTLSDRRIDHYVTWLHALEKDPHANPKLRFTVLEEALALAPTERRLLFRLLVYADSKSKEGADARALLDRQLVSGSNLAFAHYVAGLFACINQSHAATESEREARRKEAEFHFQIAHQKMPADAAVSNNLAWIMANSNPPQLDQALELINATIKMMPSEAEFRHTRGVIMVKLERWREAIDDLEVALDHDRHPDRANIHAALANAYDKLGNNKYAEFHRNEAVKKLPNK
jgi:tetratricopeptide (TPR) repeat protein